MDHVQMQLEGIRLLDSAEYRFSTPPLRGVVKMKPLSRLQLCSPENSSVLFDILEPCSSDHAIGWVLTAYVAPSLHDLIVGKHMSIMRWKWARLLSMEDNSQFVSQVVLGSVVKRS